MAKHCGIIPVLRIEWPISDFGKEDGLLNFKETKKAITVNDKSYRLVLEVIGGER